MAGEVAPVLMIRRYPLGAVANVEMPKGAQLLSVHVVGEAIYLWALVDYAAERVVRKFAMYGHGEIVPPSLSYVGSVRLPQGGGIVFHVFEKEAD